MQNKISKTFHNILTFQIQGGFFSSNEKNSKGQIHFLELWWRWDPEILQLDRSHHYQARAMRKSLIRFVYVFSDLSKIRSFLHWTGCGFRISYASIQQGKDWFWSKKLFPVMFNYFCRPDPFWSNDLRVQSWLICFPFLGSAKKNLDDLIKATLLKIRFIYKASESREENPYSSFC